MEATRNGSWTDAVLKALLTGAALGVLAELVYGILRATGVVGA